MGINVFAISIGVVAQGAFKFKTEFLVKPDRGEIVGEDVEFDAADIVPIIGGVDQSRQNICSDTSAGKIVVDTDYQISNVGLSSCPAEQSCIGNDLSPPFANDGDIVGAAVLHRFSCFSTD